MTDNEIIKALECCKRPVGTGACKDCPLDKDRPCTTTMIENALDLINRQKAEIERLQKDSERLKKVQMQLDDVKEMVGDDNEL